MGPESEIAMGAPPGTTAGAVLTFRATRAIFVRPWVIALFFLIAGLYAFSSMLLGGMLFFGRTGAQSTTVWLITGGIPWWNYPALLVVAPGGSLALPFFPTVAMVFVSIGVGIGMTVAVVIAAQLIRLRKAAAGRPLAAGSIAGFTPAVLALVTMGACCTTTAASAAGLGVVAQSTGTTINTLLANNWYLGIFQMLVVFVALLAQEAILAAYAPFLGLSTRPLVGPAAALEPPPLRWGDLASAVLRAALITAAAGWSLWAITGLFSSGNGLTDAAAWFGFLVEHLLLTGIVIVVALYPESFRSWLLGAGSPARGARLFRGLSAFLGLLVLTWVPPLWAGPQLAGLANELLGLLGAPASWGAVTPAFFGPISRALWFALGFGMLGGFLVAMAFRSRLVFSWLAPTVSDGPTTTHIPWAHITAGPNYGSPQTDLRPSGPSTEPAMSVREVEGP